MNRSEMGALIDRQIGAFLANNPAGAVSVYTDDIVHRMVGPERDARETGDACPRL